MSHVPGIVVKWRWWYPEGCIRAPGLETHKIDHLIDVTADDGENIAADIVDDYLQSNPPDGNSFEVEIVEPSAIAGVYDVELEWSPTAVANRRAA